MESWEIVKALHDGHTINDESGNEYIFDGIQIRVNEGQGYRPTQMDVSYILGKPQKFKVVSDGRD